MKELNALVEAAKEAVKDLRTEISSTVTVGDVVAYRLKIAITAAEQHVKKLEGREKWLLGEIERIVIRHLEERENPRKQLAALSALRERITELEEELDKQKNCLFCGWCGETWRHNGKPTAELLEIASEHDQQCPKNPLVQKLVRLSAPAPSERQDANTKFLGSAITKE